jgi:glucans biosynthesis protein
MRNRLRAGLPATAAGVAAPTEETPQRVDKKFRFAVTRPGFGRGVVVSLRCGAKTRSGAPCKNPPLTGKKRCRMHGGASPGPPRGNRNAWKHGRYSAAVVAEKRARREEHRARIAPLHERLQELIRAAEALSGDR